MAAPSSTTGKKGWTSVWSSAVAGLESRLDTILADDSEASAKFRLSDIAEAKERAEAEAEEARSGKKAQGLVQAQGLGLGLNSAGVAGGGDAVASAAGAEERDASRVRVNDRLAERLARVTAAKRPASPLLGHTRGGSGGGSGGGSARVSLDERRLVQESTTSEVSETPDAAQEVASALPTRLSCETPTRPSSESVTRPSHETSTRPSIEISPRPSVDLPNGDDIHSSTASSDPTAELLRLRADQIHSQQEQHIYLEKIDALQAKLTYLANQTVAAAKEANATTTTTANGETTTTLSAETKIAAKDEQIAALMLEGEQLSKTELRHLQTIKKLRAKALEDEKALADTRKRVERVEQSEKDLTTRLRKSEASERAAGEKVKQIAVIEKQVDELRIDRENAAELVRTLTVQVKEAKERAAQAEKAVEANKGSESEGKNRITTLEIELEDLRIERKLLESRFEAEVKRVNATLDSQTQAWGVREVELKNEIGVLETRVEVMRSRAEETESAGEGAAGSASGESYGKLLRQVEVLQGQYALAKGNWEVIENSLNSRLASLEGDRDESVRREAEARRKAREAALQTRRLEDLCESSAERVAALEAELKRKGEEAGELLERCRGFEGRLVDAQMALERERKVWDEERGKWMRGGGVNGGINGSVYPAQERGTSRDGGLLPSSRKPSVLTIDPRRPSPSRGFSNDLVPLRMEPQTPRPTSRRSAKLFSPTPSSPVASRQASMTSTTQMQNIDPNTIPPTPSIEIANPAEDYLPDPNTTPDAEGGNDKSFDMQISRPDLTPSTTTMTLPTHSPDRTINDLVSVSTLPTTGPSVALLERLSTSIRRLESEKAASKDELLRLQSQRDIARDEVVALMREVEVKRGLEGEVGEVRAELGGLRERYEACLEILGEREEEVEELRGDVGELKRLYREVVEEKVGKGR